MIIRRLFIATLAFSQTFTGALMLMIPLVKGTSLFFIISQKWFVVHSSSNRTRYFSPYVWNMWRILTDEAVCPMTCICVFSGPAAAVSLPGKDWRVQHRGLWALSQPAERRPEEYLTRNGSQSQSGKGSPITALQISFVQLCLSVSRQTPVSLFQWATVTFHLPHHVLKMVASAIVSELKKVNQNVAALSVASSIMDRLSYLLSSARPELGVGPGRSVDRWVSITPTSIIIFLYSVILLAFLKGSADSFATIYWIVCDLHTASFLPAVCGLLVCQLIFARFHVLQVFDVQWSQPEGNIYIVASCRLQMGSAWPDGSSRFLPPGESLRQATETNVNHSVLNASKHCKFYNVFFF